MKVNINKDTLLFGSFSKCAGNVGCKLFNICFDYHDINAIYKSFSISDLQNAVLSAKTLNFKGFAVSMPFKTEIIKYLDDCDEAVKCIDACNTVINNNGKLCGYNTDYLAAKQYLEDLNCKILYILGNGGYSKAVQYACKILNIKYEIITRKNWDKINTLSNHVIYNCTPVNDIVINKTNIFIDCINTTKTGKKLAMIQASYQYKLYTNLDFPLKID